jgi:hypothetical protein
MAYDSWLMVFVEIFHHWPKIVGWGCLCEIFTNGQRTFGLRTRTFDLRYFVRTLIIMPTIVLHSNLAYNNLIINF